MPTRRLGLKLNVFLGGSNHAPTIARKTEIGRVAWQAAPMTRLDIIDLLVEFPTQQGVTRPVDGVSLKVERGEILGLAGDSGAGKSLIVAAVSGRLEPPGRIGRGQILLDGQRIDRLSAHQMRVAGHRIGVLFQDPVLTLDPLRPIGRQLIERVQQASPCPAPDATARALTWLMELGLTAPEAWWDCYPHQFSGTMRQLMAAALTLCAAPSLVIADEPTMAMEAAAHTQIIELLRRLSRDQGLSVILVTPDALEVAAIADRVVVLHGGRIVGADQGAGHAAPEPAISSPHGRTPAPHLAKHRHGG